MLFRHEGWPLCIHEKIVVQLASIDWRILKPGDFYLQVVPYLKKSPRIVLKCLAKDKHNVEEVVIPEVSYTSIFTLEWLSTINGERMGIALENCLLTTDDKIFRVPWDNVVNPEFINKPKVIENNIITPEIAEEPSALCLPMDHAECSSPDLESQYLQEPSPNRDNLVSSPAPQSSETLVNGVCTNPVPEEDLKSDIEGEYVELAEVSLPCFGPQTGSLTQSVSLSYLTQPRTRVNASKGKHRFIVIQDSTYSKNLIQPALMQKERCQMDALRTSAEVLKNVIPLESNRMMAHEELSPEGQLVSGGPGSMGNSPPAAASPACGAEDSSPGEQEACSEHSIDWRYALCSYSDVCAGDGASSKAQMTGSTGNMQVEGDGSSRNPGVDVLEHSPETNLDAAAEQGIQKGRGEALAESQSEVTQMDPSSVSVPGPLGPHCPLKEDPGVSCQSVGESVAPVQAAALPVVPESSDGGVERGSSSGNVTDGAAVRACCGEQEENMSSPLNPPEQMDEGEVDEVELGRREGPEEVKEIEQTLAVNGNQTGHSYCSVRAPAGGLLSDGKEQELSVCQHKKGEEAVLLPAALSAESEEMAGQLDTSDPSMGLEAQAEGSSQFKALRSGERHEERQRRAENQGHGSEASSVLNPECIAAQDLQGGEENQGSFCGGEKSKTGALKTLESIKEELEVGPSSSGPAEGNAEPPALHSHQEAVSGAPSPKGTAAGCLCGYLVENR